MVDAGVTFSTSITYEPALAGNGPTTVFSAAPKTCASKAGSPLWPSTTAWRSPPLAEDVAWSEEYFFATFVQFLSELSASSSFRAASIFAASLLTIWRTSRVSGVLN